MNAILEAHRGTLIISTDPSLLNLDTVCDFLKRSYWANDRPRDAVERSLENSLVFGVYDGARQIGVARVITDFATWAWLEDVFATASLMVWPGFNAAGFFMPFIWQSVFTSILFFRATFSMVSPFWTL